MLLKNLAPHGSTECSMTQNWTENKVVYEVIIIANSVIVYRLGTISYEQDNINEICYTN